MTGHNPKALLTAIRKLCMDEKMAKAYRCSIVVVCLATPLFFLRVSLIGRPWGRGVSRTDCAMRSVSGVREVLRKAFLLDDKFLSLMCVFVFLLLCLFVPL